MILRLLLLALALCAAPAYAQQATPVDTVLSEEAEDLAEDLDGDAHAGDHDEQHAEDHGDGHGAAAPVFLVIPFVILLLMIATGPLFFPHHWHHHYPRYAIGLGVLVAAYYWFLLHDAYPILHAAQEYFSFIALLASLYIASGGILIRTDFEGTPKANTILLLVGAVISNVIGTTGASMLLIRPYMRLNRGRIKPYHIIFFIFLVSNVGGALTPIGDPPLFLGFLRGVPFFWTMTHIWYLWLPTILVIAAVFYWFDSRNKEKSVREVAEETHQEDRLVDDNPVQAPLSPTTPSKPIQITGAKNFFWLAVVIAAVFIDPNVIGEPFRGSALDLVGTWHLPFGIREIIMGAVCVLAFKLADKKALAGNDFNFEPIREVGFLFIGIFLTMQPALGLIGAFATENAESLSLTPFFFGTGFLSGVLDNAPTYVAFLAAAMGKFGLNVNTIADVGTFAGGLTEAGITVAYLQAISVAAVFFGALTYIGNGPNFMVKAIAESSGVECPSFFGYMIKYSLPILVPIYVVIWIIMTFVVGTWAV
jgi:Na+/H+ antiporter NhaD/arsenite permease-like protein